MSDAETTLDYVRNLDGDTTNIRTFLLFTESNIPVWSSLYRWYLQRYQGGQPEFTHCCVGILDVERRKLHILECDWYSGLSHTVLCPDVYAVPRSEPLMFTICMDGDSDTTFSALECTSLVDGLTLDDFLDRLMLAVNITTRKMNPLTLLRIYYGKLIDCFVCTSFAQFIIEPHNLRYKHPLTVDGLATDLILQQLN